MRKRNKVEKPSSCRRWKRESKIYHSKSTKHFFVGIAKKIDSVAGHDATTHPSLKSDGKPRNRYLKLTKNPNPNDKRVAYVHKNLRVVNSRFEDSRKKRLTPKKGWKIHRRDKKRLRKLDKKKSAQLALD